MRAVIATIPDNLENVGLDTAVLESFRKGNMFREPESDGEHSNLFFKHFGSQKVRDFWPLKDVVLVSGLEVVAIVDKGKADEEVPEFMPNRDKYNEDGEVVGVLTWKEYTRVNEHPEVDKVAIHCGNGVNSLRYFGAWDIVKQFVEHFAETGLVNIYNNLTNGHEGNAAWNALLPVPEEV